MLAFNRLLKVSFLFLPLGTLCCLAKFLNSSLDIVVGTIELYGLNGLYKFFIIFSLVVNNFFGLVSKKLDLYQHDDKYSKYMYRFVFAF